MATSIKTHVALEQQTPSINTALLDRIFNLVSPNHTVANALIDKITDNELAMSIDEAVNDLVSEVIKAAFAVGWQCARNPEILIFGEVRHV